MCGARAACASSLFAAALQRGGHVVGGVARDQATGMWFFEALWAR